MLSFILFNYIRSGLLRQYKRVRGEKKKKFSYRDIKSVYTIVLFEKSLVEFHEYPDIYYHFFEQKYDTGLHMEFLQKYLFIPLDIFRKILQYVPLLSCSLHNTLQIHIHRSLRRARSVL